MKNERVTNSRLRENGYAFHFYMLWDNGNGCMTCFSYAVGARRTYIPMQRGYMFPQTKHVETIVCLCKQ